MQLSLPRQQRVAAETVSVLGYYSTYLWSCWAIPAPTIDVGSSILYDLDSAVHDAILRPAREVAAILIKRAAGARQPAASFLRRVAPGRLVCLKYVAVHKF